MMDRAEMVAWLRNKVCQYRDYAKQDRGWYIPVKPLEIEAIELQEIADELERLGHLEAEHQGCTENMASLVRERDALNRRWTDALEERNAARAQRDSLREAVSEWVCDACEHVIPGPPKDRPWDLSCPQCVSTKDGVIMPRNRYERVKAERQSDAAYRALDEALEWVETLGERLKAYDGQEEDLPDLDALDPRKEAK